MGLQMARMQVLERAGKHTPKNLKCGGLGSLLIFTAYERKVSFPLHMECCQEKINLISIQAEILLKLRIVIQLFEFTEVVSVILRAALEGRLIAVFSCLCLFSRWQCSSETAGSK